MNRMNTTRFMTQEELMEQLTEIDLRQQEECLAGGVPLLVRNQKAYVDTGDNHTLIFGATGSKKTRLLGMPTVEILSRAGESFLVTDPKGEIFEKTKESIRKRGYQVYCLNLRDFRNGVAWNPISLPFDYYQRGDKSKAVEMVCELARMIAGENVQDPFWTNTAADVITGLILILLKSASREECNIKSVLALWEQYLENKEETMNMISGQFGGTLIARKLRSLDNDSNKTVGSIEAVVATGLNRLSANEDFIEFLSQEGMEFDTVTREKTAIFLIVPDENRFYHFIASLFMEQMYEVLIKEAQRSPQLKLKIRMNYIVDEFANIPKMENMEAMITAARSRNIRFNLLVQSKMQLEEKYGSVASVICDNCNNWIYLYSKDYGLLSEISRLCGNVIYDNHMTVPLISEFELQHLKKEEGEALVLAGRNYPCIVNLADIDEYPLFVKKMETNQSDGIIQTWLPVCVFTLKKTKGRSTCQYIFTKEMNERRRRKEGLSRDTWLVGACNGVILMEDNVTKQDVLTGAGILRLCLNEFADISDIEDLEWYMADSSIQQMYYTRLYSTNPEMVFLTLQELGTEHFIPVQKNFIQKLKGAGLC